MLQEGMFPIMKKNPILTFIVGAVMLTVGLFWLMQVVQVSSLWGGGWMVGGLQVTGGATLVPLIAGIVWVFFDPKSVGAKILCILGAVIVIAGILLSVRFYVRPTSLYVFILIFVLIAGGCGLLARVVFTSPDRSGSGATGAGAAGRRTKAKRNSRGR